MLFGCLGEQKNNMVEVIEYGEKPERCECNGCNSILQYMQKDLNLCWSPNVGHYLSITCPVCNKEIYIRQA